MANDTSLGPGAPQPHDPGLEQRVQVLEEIIAEIRTDLRSMRHELADLKAEQKTTRQEIAKLAVDLARVEGRTSQMPTLLQLITVVIAIWGMAFATLRFSIH